MFDATPLTPILLTDQQRADYEFQAKFVAELGVTRPELALFTAIYYGFTIPPSYLPARAAQEDYNPIGLRVTEEECRVALPACFAKGWLQVIDENVRAEIADALRKDQVLGPIYGGIPEAGCVDFTEAGAD